MIEHNGMLDQSQLELVYIPSAKLIDRYSADVRREDSRARRPAQRRGHSLDYMLVRRHGMQTIIKR